MSEYSVIGKSLPRVDGIVKLTGEARFCADLRLPGMLWGKMLRSPYAHARILNIDTSKAERLPGVKAIAIGKDFGSYRYGYMPTSRDETPLAVDKVLFIGDEVAAVAAIDEDIAEEAVDLIEVEYEPLPVVSDPLEAMKDGAPRIHDHAERNIACKSTMNVGDVDKGFRESDYVREDTFRTPRVTYGYLEPHATLADYDSTGKVTIWTTSQSPYFVYRDIAEAFKLPQNRVRVIQPYLGTGYGGKNYCFPLNFCAVLLSMKTGRPVKIVYTQNEVLLASPRRCPMIIEMKTGVKRDGTLVARYCKAIGDGGAHALIGPVTMYLVGAFLTLPYRLDNVKYEGYRVYTNVPPPAAHRGHGISQSHFASEVQLNMIAEELGIDPVDIRLRNAVQAGHVTANGLKVTSCGLTECIQKAAEAANWKEKYQKGKIKGKVSRGIGFACNDFISGLRIMGHSACAALVKVHEDGTISLSTGATDIGQGSDTVLAQIAAEELGIGLEDIKVNLPDTDFTPLDLGTLSSRVTMFAGNAVKLAAADAKRQLAEVAAEGLGADVRDIDFKNHRAFVKGNPGKSVSFRRLARMATHSGGGRVIYGTGYYGPEPEIPDVATCMGNATPAYSFGAQVAEVEVDTETGHVKYISSTAAHDCGVALNPMSVEGQGDGCVSVTQGQTLSEELVMQNGQTLNANLVDYRMPRAEDSPQMKTILVETIDPAGPFGAKEGSEVLMVTGYPAIANAIHNATGVWIKDLPITPEKVLKALKEKEREERQKS